MFEFFFPDLETSRRRKKKGGGNLFPVLSFPFSSVGPPGLRPEHLLVRDPPLLVLPRSRPPSRLPQLPAPRHGAPFLAALLRVHLQQHPHPPAELAAARHAQRARARVLEQRLDLGAVARRLQLATKEWNCGVLAITHFRRLLQELTPTKIHVVSEGRVVATGGAELSEVLERDGYEPFRVKSA